jgi:hypothetical protein
MRFGAHLLLALSVLFPSFALAQAKPDSADAKGEKQLEKIVRTHDGWSKINSPGISIELREVRTEPAPGRKVKVTYQLLAHGISPDELLDVVQWPITASEPSTMLHGASVLPSGLLACAGRKPGQCGDSSKPDDVLEFALTGPAPGEPLRVAVANKKVRATAIAVPLPIEGTDNGCTLSAVRLLPDFEIAYITGSGFPPNSDVHLDSLSLDEKLYQVFKTDANGKLGFVHLPFVEGHETGTATIWSRDPKCQPAVRIEWGARSAGK